MPQTGSAEVRDHEHSEMRVVVQGDVRRNRRWLAYEIKHETFTLAEIVHDEAKRRTNIATHGGLDFADLDAGFFLASLIVPAKRGGSWRYDRGCLCQARRRTSFGRFDASGQFQGKEDAMTTRSGKAISAAREADIQRMIAADPDAPEATDEQLAQAKTFAVAFPDIMATIQKGRGRPLSDSPRKQISIRLDPDVIDKFRATGKGRQSRINEVLKKAEI